MANPDNPYAAPQTIDTRQPTTVSLLTPGVPENRDYRWLKRGLGSLAMLLSPLTFLLIARFQEFAVLGLSVFLPICCGMLAAVPPRTPGRICFIVTALAQAVGCFCLFAVVLLPQHDRDEYHDRFNILATTAAGAELVCYASLIVGLIRVGHWLSDRWLLRTCYGSLIMLGLLFSSNFWLVGIVTDWNWIRASRTALALLSGLSYLSFWVALLLGLRIPRLIAARIADPPRFTNADN